jgi:probable HAF family extracellular repeat protein
MQICRPLSQLILFAALAVPFAGHADPRYSVTVVGTAGSTAADINNAGQMAGWFAAGASTEHGFFYSAGTLTDLGTFGGANSRANALNDLGQVVGYADTSAGGRRAFLYSSGAMTNLGTLGQGYSLANGINNAGAVVGMGIDAMGQGQGFLYSGGSMQSLAPFAPAGAVGAAYDINEAGQIVGTYTAGPMTAPEWPSSGFLLSGGVFTPMGHIGSAYESVALSINDHGQAVGHAHEHLENFFPFIYSADGLQRLGIPSEYHTVAYDINNLGQSVGQRIFDYFGSSHAMLYDACGGCDAWLDLNTLVDPASGWTLTQANAINDLQQIAATGCRDGACYALRLDLITAVPEPASTAMLLAGLGMFGWRSRRRGKAFQPRPIATA